MPNLFCIIMTKQIIYIFLFLFTYTTLLPAQSKKELQAELSLAQEKQETLLREISRLRVDSVTYITKVETLEKKLEELEDENMQLREEKDNALSSSMQTLEDYNKLEVSYNELLENSSQESKHIASMKAKLDSALSLTELMDEEIEDLEDFLDEKDEDIMFLQEKIVKMREEYGLELEDE